MIRVGSSSKTRVASEGTVAGGSFYRMRPFFRDEPGVERGLDAFIVEYPAAKSVIRPHFHAVDQFQVVIAGGGRLGKHPLDPISVHYTDGYTPYGPIVAADEGISFMTLRATPDRGIFYMPGSRDKMARKAGRGEAFHVPVDPMKTLYQDGVAQEALLETQPDGLGVHVVRAAPGVTVRGPDPRGSSGQYYVVINGSGCLDNEELPVFSVLFVWPDQGPLAMTAGASGLDAVVLQFPLPRPAEEGSPAKVRARKSAPAAA